MAHTADSPHGKATKPHRTNTKSAETKPGWFDERLGIKAFYEKFGRKAFPVHSTYFFGEMAVFCFIILVLTGLSLMRAGIELIRPGMNG